MSESLKTVLVDMDGVLAGFDKEVLNRIEARYPHIPLLGARQNFYVSDDYPEHAQLVRELSDEQGFFDSLPLVDDALEGWERIIDLGYKPRICSSPISTNPNSRIEKLDWLRRHFTPVFGSVVVEQAIITKDKHEVDGIALIDDRPEIRHANEASWKHVIFDQPYNQHVPGLRLNGWLDEALPEVLELTANHN